jgi:hypothetical protein
VVVVVVVVVVVAAAAAAAAAAVVGAVVMVMFNTVTTECVKEMTRSRPARVTDVPIMPNHEQNFNLLWIINLTQDLWL